MEFQDFNKLTIGQVIYFNGKTDIIKSLEAGNDGKKWIGLVSQDPLKMWDSTHPHFSLTPPKEKKDYWLWNFKDTDGTWYRSNRFYDDNGAETNNKDFVTNWDTTEKIKVESSKLTLEI